MNCGVCGGEVRGYRGTLFRRPIADWKHKSVPPGTLPHRPVLGTPVDAETLERTFKRKPVEDSTILEVPKWSPPLIGAQETWVWNLPRSVGTVMSLGLDHRWSVICPPAYWQAVDEAEYLVLKMRRRDLGAVGCWLKRPATRDIWAFDVGFTLARTHVRQVGSKQLKDWISQPDEECPDCGASSAAHHEGECPL